MEKNLKKSSSILGIKKLNVLEQNAVRGGKAANMKGHHEEHHSVHHSENISDVHIG